MIRRDIDAQFDQHSMFTPTALLVDGGGDDPISQFDLRLGIFDDAQELFGEQQPASRMIPTQQSLRPHHAPGDQLDLGLVIQLELSLCQSIAYLQQQLMV